MKKASLALISAVVLLQAAAVDLQAIPAFARKYQMTCKTCHTPFPKLKPYGEEFAANGYVIKDKDAPRYNIDTGDDFLSLIRDLPLAVRLDGFFTYNNSATKQLDFASPFMMKFLSGGEITKNISYFFYFIFSEMGEIAGIEDAFLMFNNLFHSSLDFSIGQFQVSDPIFKRELRLTLEDYRIFATEVGDSSVTLTYDRGVMLSYDLPTRTSVTVEVVNGSGIGQSNIFQNLDSDKYKNFVLRLSQDAGQHLRLGGFGYLGKEKPEAAANSLWMAGADATVTAKPFELNLQYVERHDDNPFFAVSDLVPADGIKTRGGFAELVYLPKGDDSRWYLAGLYNYVNSDLDELDYSSATLHYGRMIRRNMRATAEFTYVFDSVYKDYGRFSLGLITAF
jgi:hypothetical protein